MKHLLTTLATTVTFLALAVVPAFAATASLSLPSSTISQDGTVTVTVGINTQGADTVGSDLVIQYNPAILQFQSASFTSPFSQNFTTADSDTIKLSSTFTTASDLYNGSKNIATLIFKPLAAGSTSLSFKCQNDTTNDTNIWERLTGDDIINCGSLTSPSLTITASSGTGDNTDTTDSTTDTNTNDTNTDTTNNDSSSSDNSDSSSSSDSSYCPSPPQPINFKSAPNNQTSILLSWDHVADADHYSLEYGTSPGSYIYGISNLGHTNIFLVEYLKPATIYYFALKSISNCGGASSAITTSNKTFGSSTTTTQAKATPIPSNIPKTSTLATTVKTTTTTKTVAELLDEPIVPTPTPTPSSPAAQTYQSPKPQVNLLKILIFFIPLILAVVGYLIYRFFKNRRPPTDGTPDLDLDIKENILPSDQHYTNYSSPRQTPLSTPPKASLPSHPPAVVASPSPVYPHNDSNNTSSAPTDPPGYRSPHPVPSTLPNNDPVTASDLTKTHLVDDQPKS